MNAADLVLMVVGCYFVIRGLFIGISGQILSLIGVAGGFYCSLTLYAPVAQIITETIGVHPLIATTLTMLGIFLLLNAGCALIGKFVKEFLKATNLTGMDKFLGGLTGFVKLYLIALLLFVIVMLLSPFTGDAWVKDSKGLAVTAKTWPIIYPLLEKAGALPDIEALQEEARNHMIEQARKNLKNLEQRSNRDKLEALEHILVHSADILSQDNMLDLFLSLEKNTTSADIED